MKTKTLLFSLFAITLFFSIFTLFSTSTFAQCDGNQPAIHLGNDTTLCKGQSLTLTAPFGFNLYSWNNGIQSPSINVDTAGIYVVTGGIVGGNIVSHGNFEGGTTASANSFTTQYVTGTGGPYGLLSNPGQYTISTSPSLVHTNFNNCVDHTPGIGNNNMFVANGASSGNTIVWAQTITVTPNTNYIFSMWQMSVENTTVPAQLQLFVNGTPISNLLSCNQSGCQWTENSGIWNSAATTTANLTIVNATLAASGNDFALDDIFFAPICTVIDSIKVDYDTVNVNAGPDITVCANQQPVQLTATSNVPMSNYAWSNGIQAASFSPTASGLYVVNGTSTHGCHDVDSVNVVIKSMNWSIDSLVMQKADCGLNNGLVYAMLNPSNPNDPAYAVPPQYQWSGPGANSTTTFSASVWTDLPVGWYYFQVNVNGCFRYDSIQILPATPPVAVLAANPITGYAPLAVNFQNTSQQATSFYWDFGNSSTLTVNDLSPQSQTYNTPGDYVVTLTAKNGNCDSTVSVTIQVIEEPIEPPVLPVSVDIANVFSPNGDGKNDLFSFKLLNITAFEITIVNRWGNLMYSSNSINAAWDGKLPDGREAVEGVYFYTYKAVGLQGEQFGGSDFLTLER